MAATSKFFSERELLDRLAYLGPITTLGGGVTRTYDWSGGVTDATIWTPQSGNRFIISCISINTSAACTVSIYDESDSDIDRVFKGALAANANVVIPFPIPRCSRDPDRKLNITTSATGGFVTVWGWESGAGELTTTTSVSTSSSSVTTTSVSTSSYSTSSSSVTTSSYSTSSSSQTTSSSSSSTSSVTTSSQSTSSSSSSSSSTSSSSSSSSSSSETTTSASITYL